jgi:hypothetical protein
MQVTDDPIPTPLPPERKQAQPFSSQASLQALSCVVVVTRSQRARLACQTKLLWFMAMFRWH